MDIDRVVVGEIAGSALSTILPESKLRADRLTRKQVENSVYGRPDSVKILIPGKI